MAEHHKHAAKIRLERSTPDQRKAVASAGAAARWAKVDPERAALAKAEFGGEDRPLVIGEMSIPCYVLSDERRVLSAAGFQNAIGIAAGGSMKAGMSRLELFASGERVKPFVSNDLFERVRNPIPFVTPSGGRANGYEAEMLVEICEAVLAARASEKGLQQQQRQIAHQCELIMRGLARVGIVALVDEVTGYQEVRKRDALHKILEAYISPELMKWQKRFPDSFYEEMFRLHGWPYDPESVARPGVVGKFTNTYVYEQLPDGVLDELRRLNPKNASGSRRAAHHQLLSDTVGHPHLEKQLTAVTTILRVADDWPGFKRMFAKAFPKKGDQIDMLTD